MLPEPGTTPQTTSGDGDATATRPVPALDRTARLPTIPPQRRARRRRVSRSAWVVVAAAVVAVVLVTTLAIVAFTGPDPANPAGSAQTLPGPVDDALTGLEEAVRP